MPEAFFRSRKLLDRDDSENWHLSGLTAIVLLCAWALWFSLAQVAIYRVSDAARLESGGAAYQVQAPVAGRVISTSLNLGLQVGKGRLLVQLDDFLSPLAQFIQRLPLRNKQRAWPSIRLAFSYMEQSRLSAMPKTKLDVTKLGAAPSPKSIC